jgi:hypothetical protein
VGIEHSILEANQGATIGSVTGLDFLCRSLAQRNGWEVNERLKSHRLREGPAPVADLVQGLLAVPLDLGCQQRPRQLSTTCCTCRIQVDSSPGGRGPAEGAPRSGPRGCASDSPSDGPWTMDDEPWTMAVGPWSTVHGPWSMVHGQLFVEPVE